MTNKEYILETIKRVVPDSEWCGDSKDQESFNSISIQLEAVEIILDKLLKHIYIGGQEENWNAKRIMKEKQEALKELINEYNYLFELVGYRVVELDEEN